VGFAGCNRMFGGYALEGESLKFAQMGGTKMACLDQERMRLEQDYFDMLGRVSRWKISGHTLELLDSGGKPVAAFAAATPADSAR
jgi:heat shock protein HslJ